MPEKYDQGINETAHRSALKPGEMQACVGMHYKPADDRLHVIRGGTAFGTVVSAAQGVAFFPFDNGPDAVVVRANDAIYAEDAAAATPAIATANISPALTGLGGDRMIAAHYNDRRYLALGLGQSPQMISSGGALPLTSRQMGLDAPQSQVTATPQTLGNTVRPTTIVSNSGWINTAFLTDALDTTFAGATVKNPTETASIVFDFSALGVDDTGSQRRQHVVWELAGVQNPADVGSDDDASVPTLGTVRIQFEKQDAASAGVWVEFYNELHNMVVRKGTTPVAWTTDTTSVKDNAKVRATITSVIGGGAITLRIYDAPIVRGGAGTAFDATIIYYVTEFADGFDGPRNKELTVVLLAASSHNGVLVTFPPQQNPAATHRKLWRTTDGGTINTATQLAKVPIATVDFLDQFLSPTKDEAGGDLYRMLSVGSIQYNAWDPPPPLEYIWSHKGQLLGISGRTIRSSLQGEPEYWPEIYNVPAIPLPEHDTLLAGAELSGFSVVVATGGALRLEDVPRIANTQIIQGEVLRIEGAPGCVGYRAFTKLPWKGSPGVAYISHTQGVVLTNGHNFEFVADEIDWSKFANLDLSGMGLFWDAERRVLVMSYAAAGGAGVHDTYYMGHVERAKSGGVQWTGPHAGNLTYLASGNVAAGGHRLYSASASAVRRENDPATVEPQSWSVTSRRAYGGGQAFSVPMVRLRHGSFGVGATAQLAYTTGRDDSAHESTTTKTIAVASDRTTQAYVGRYGDWHEYTLSGSAVSGSLSDLDIEGQTGARAGKVSAA